MKMALFLMVKYDQLGCLTSKSIHSEQVATVKGMSVVGVSKTPYISVYQGASKWKISTAFYISEVSLGGLS